MTSDPNRRARDIKAAPSPAPSTAQLGSTPVKTLLAILSVIVLAISGVGYFAVGRLGGNMASISDLKLGGGKGFKEGQAPDGAMDILLVGSDSRTDAQGNVLSDEELAQLHAGVSEGEDNTDTIMLIRVPNDGSRATAVSIPRDTYVHDDLIGNTKINGVYAAHKDQKTTELEEENATARAAGQSDKHSSKDIEAQGVLAGRTALIDALHDLTGVSIDHYAEIGLVGFTLLTEAVGGVDVCLNADVDDEMSGAKFSAGQQTISGAQALAFVRQRYELPRGDLDRIVRQQAFMASLVSKVLDAGTLTSPSKMNKLGDAVERSVVIDSDWDIMSFATQLADLAGGNVTFNTIPVTSVDGVGDYGESIITVDVEAVHKFFKELAFTEETLATSSAESSAAQAKSGDKPVADDIELNVLNASAITGLASSVTSWLTTTGYKVQSTANAEQGLYAESQVVAADANDQRAKDLAKQLGNLPVTANENLEKNTFVVVTAEDYAGPSDKSANPSEDASSTGEDMSHTSDQVGTPGGDFGTAEVSPKIDAGGNGPRCVN